MKYAKYLFPICAMLMAACGAADKAPSLAGDVDTLSWAIGRDIGLGLKKNAVQLNEEVLLSSLRSTLADENQPLSDSLLAAATQRAMARIQAASGGVAGGMVLPQQVQQRQEQYFAQLVKEHPSVKRHPAGFYYEELRAGKGATATYAARVRFDYRSYLLFSGEPYDQTYGRRDPIIHVLGKPMFPGLIEGMQLMSAGSIYRFYFPYQLAFGEQGSGDIPPCTPLIYEVELHEIYKD